MVWGKPFRNVFFIGLKIRELSVKISDVNEPCFKIERVENRTDLEV